MQGLALGLGIALAFGLFVLIDKIQFYFWKKRFWKMKASKDKKYQHSGFTIEL